MRHYGFLLPAVFLACTAAIAATVSDRTQTDFSGPGNDIRLAMSPDGTRALWGVSIPNAPRGSEIMESVKTPSGWSTPKPVPFNSPQNDNDPFFSAEGRTVLFLSNRDGGYGQTDLYSVSFDPQTGSWGEPVNLGPNVNTAEGEWAPSMSADGEWLLFDSDGHGGFGKHDLFVARRGQDGWQKPVNLGPGINTPLDDFNATFAPGGRFIVYSQGVTGQNAHMRLHYAEKTPDGWQVRGELPDAVNCGTHSYAPAFSASEPGAFYWSADCEGGRGGRDIWRTKLTLP